MADAHGPGLRGHSHALSHETPDEFADALARAGFKLTYRDLGPRSADYLGKEVPGEEIALAGPGAGGRPLVDRRSGRDRSESGNSEDGWVCVRSRDDVREHPHLYSAVRTCEAVQTGARIRLVPQKDWAVNRPDRLATVLEALGRRAVWPHTNGQLRRQEGTHSADSNRPRWRCRHGTGGERRRARYNGPFHARSDRCDARSDGCGVRSGVLEPEVDGFRNYAKAKYTIPAEAMLVDKAQLLTLTAPEMTVLVGGLRALDANADGSANGVSHRPTGCPQK